MAHAKMSIKETKELAAFLVATIVSIRSFKAQGIKITLANLLKNIGSFLPAVLQAQVAFEGGNQIPKEWLDLDDAEIAEIVKIFDEVTNSLGLPETEKRKKISKLLGAAVHFYDAIVELIEKPEPVA